MASLHERSLHLGNRTTDELGRLFDAIGSTGAPNGWLLRAYRNARRALSGNLYSLRDVEEVLSELRDLTEQYANDLFDDALALGLEQAGDELDVYGLPVSESRRSLSPLVAGAVGAFLAVIDQQIAAVRGLVASGSPDPGLILGDDSHAGLLAPGPALIEARKWTTLTTTNSWSSTVNRSLEKSGDTTQYKRQAVAVIDDRTTDCCLRVHGQVVGLDEDFTLEGTPRFADHVRTAPFHWNCRSSVVLVRVQDADDAVTRLMQTAAETELDARERTGTREVIRPANAGTYRAGERGTVRQRVSEVRDEF